jgi:hypothetical protein
MSSSSSSSLANINYELCSDLESSSDSKHDETTNKDEEVLKNEPSMGLDASMIIIGVVTFVGDSARGILFPALWPLCEKLGGSKVDLGIYCNSILRILRTFIFSQLFRLSCLHFFGRSPHGIYSNGKNCG